MLLRTARHGDGATDAVVQLVGFSRCGQPGTSSAEGAEGGPQVELRAPHMLDAPELRGRRSSDVRGLYAADVWGLGVLLDYLVTGAPLHLRAPDVYLTSPATVCLLATRTHPPASTALDHEAAELRKALLSLAAEMLHVDPAMRPPATAVCAWLDGLLGGVGLAPPSGLPPGGYEADHGMSISGCSSEEAGNGSRSNRSRSSASCSQSRSEEAEEEEHPEAAASPEEPPDMHMLL